MSLLTVFLKILAVFVLIFFVLYLAAVLFTYLAYGLAMAAFVVVLIAAGYIIYKLNL